MATLAHVTPEVLRWARESIGYEIGDATARIGIRPEKFEGAEIGDLMLTLRQAERAAAGRSTGPPSAPAASPTRVERAAAYATLLLPLQAALSTARTD